MLAIVAVLCGKELGPFTRGAAILPHVAAA
jgi:hypothetical protein